MAEHVGLGATNHSHLGSSGSVAGLNSLLDSMDPAAEFTWFSKQEFAEHAKRRGYCGDCAEGIAAAHKMWEQMEAMFTQSSRCKVCADGLVRVLLRSN